jgi:hypothetical protein
VIRFNDWLASKITRAVGTMYVAYLFAMVAVTGFPGLLGDGVTKYTLWTSTIFLQLVLLSIILVGQGIQGRAADVQAKETHDAVLAELADLRADHLEDLHQLIACMHGNPQTGPCSCPAG